MLAMHVFVLTDVPTSDLRTHVCNQYACQGASALSAFSILRCRYRHTMGTYTRLGNADNESAHSS